MRPSSARRGLVLGLGLALGGTARAAPLELSEIEDVEALSLTDLLERPVIAASRYAQKPGSSPTLVSTVDADQIDRLGYRTLGEALRGVRGVYSSNDRNYSYIGVRGLSLPGDYNSRIALSIDDHGINDAGRGWPRARAADDRGRPDRDPPRITVTATTPAGMLQIEVADSGVGIAREAMARMFASGFTTKPHAHGYGLHASALAARQLGGELTVASPGTAQGATFTLRIPIGNVARAPDR